jgi:hypothetical protein
MARLLAAIDFRLTDFAGVDKRSHACLGKAMAILIHASAQCRGLNAILAAILLVVSRAGLLQCFAIS